MKNAPTFNQSNKPWFIYMAVLLPLLGTTYLYGCGDSPKTQIQRSGSTLENSKETNLNKSNIVDFSGIWSDDKNNVSTSSFTIELRQNQAEIEGTLQYETWNEKGQTLTSSGFWTAKGLITDNSANLTLYDPSGKKTAYALILKKGRELQFELPHNNLNLLPNKTKLWKQ